MQKDQIEFFKFVRDHHTWHKKIYSIHMGGVMNSLPTFTEHIFGELINEEEENNQVKDY